MMVETTIGLVVFVSILCGTVSQVQGFSSGGVKLKDVDTLVFKTNQYTNNRREHSEPQLKCLGGPGKCKYQPRLVKCHNKGVKGSGEGYKNIQWHCDAELAPGYSFDRVRINCEPYEHPNDVYVVKGSCGLEYVLDYDEKDHPKSGRRSNLRQDDDNGDGIGVHNRKHKEVGNWLIYLVKRIPIKSAELFFKNIFTFIAFSAIIYLFFFGWPGLSTRNRSSTPPWDPADPTDISYNRTRPRVEREESIWTTIIKVVLEFAFEKILKAFIR